VITGAEAMGVRSLDFEKVTTPQLCWLVSQIKESDNAFHMIDKTDYVKHFVKAYKAF
jgi:hypothetical protein